MEVIYIDQNQWVRLARVLKDPSSDQVAARVGEKLRGAVDSGQVCLPLTAANIYETYKINDASRRKALALVQSVFSGGVVFRGRRARLVEEIGDMILACPSAVVHQIY